MKKIFRLTINELQKQIYKKSFPIMFTIVICLSILIPLMTQKLVKDNYYDYNTYNTDSLDITLFGNSNHDLLIYYYDSVKDTTLENEEDFKVFTQYIEKYKQCISKYDGIRASIDSFRYVAYDDIRINIQKNVAYELLLSGVKFEGNIYFKKFPVFNNLDIGTEEEAQEYIRINNEQIEIYDDVVLNYNFKKYFETLRDLSAQSIQNLKEDLEYFNNPQSNETISSEATRYEYIKVTEKGLELYQTLLEIYESLLNREIQGAENEYILNYLERYETLFARGNEQLLSRDDYLANLYSNYEEYVKLGTLEIEKAKEDAEIIKYALLNDINYDKNGIRKALELLYITMPVVVGIFIISIASTIVADETAKSTIKSLLAKPNRRWKVLTAKFLAPILLMFLSVVIYSICFIITCLIMYNASDILIPMLEYENGVIEVNYIVFILRQISICIIPLIFVTLFSICMSTYFSIPVVSAAFSSVIIVGHTILTSILGLGTESIIVYTFLPHLNVLNFTDFDYMIRWMNKYNYDFSVGNSILILAINIVFFITMAYIIFTKKDMKS